MTTKERYITTITGTTVSIPGDSIDTDRIIPARYMKGITFDGLGEYAFFDERFDEQGVAKNHPFNDTRYNGSSILIVGSNFGCGSSREHAPQALMRYGIRALIGISFADIFTGNCVQLGIPVVSITREDHQKLLSVIARDVKTKCRIDLRNKKVITGTIVLSVGIDDSSLNALVSGLWDTTALLLEGREKIIEKANSLQYVNW